MGGGGQEGRWAREAGGVRAGDRGRGVQRGGVGCGGGAVAAGDGAWPGGDGASRGRAPTQGRFQHRPLRRAPRGGLLPPPRLRRRPRRHQGDGLLPQEPEEEIDCDDSNSNNNNHNIMWKIECNFHSSLLFDFVNELIDSIAGVQRYDCRQRSTYYYGNLIVVIAVFSHQIEMALINSSYITAVLQLQ